MTIKRNGARVCKTNLVLSGSSWGSLGKFIIYMCIYRNAPEHDYLFLEPLEEGLGRGAQHIKLKWADINPNSDCISNVTTVVPCHRNAGCIETRVGTQSHGGMLPATIPGNFRFHQLFHNTRAGALIDRKHCRWSGLQRRVLPCYCLQELH